MDPAGVFLVAKLRVHNFSVSLDGFGAGPSQDRVNPLGVGGEALHDWQVSTRSFRKQHGDEHGGTTGSDDDFVARAFQGIGAWIMGRSHARRIHQERIGSFAAQPHWILIATVCTLAHGRSQPGGASSFFRE
jgi:hypothetical protein